MLRPRVRPKMGVRQESQIRSPGHMKWVRQRFQCCITTLRGHICSGKMHAHHCREGANGGMGLKPDDSTVVALCEIAHEEIHRTGWRTFEAKYGLDLSRVAADLWRASPHRKIYEAKK